MSSTVGVGGGSAPDKARMLLDLSACLGEWQRALAQGSQPIHANMPRLRSISSHLQPQLHDVGFGGIAVHLGELIRRVDAAGAAGDPRESLSALYELAEQAERSLTAPERALHAQMASIRSMGSAAPAGSPGTATRGVEQIAGPGPEQTALAPASMPKTMLGLRAFGARKPEAARPSPQQVSADSAEGRNGLLGLRRDRRGSSAPNPSPLARDDRPLQANGAPNAAARNVNELLSGIDRLRGGRDVRQQRAPTDQRSAPRRGWRFRLITIGSMLIGLAGLVLAVAFLTRRAGTWGHSPVAAAASSLSSGTVPLTTSEQSRTHLLADDETFSSLVAQVHGRGKESSELRALVNEQAQLVARSLSKSKCEGSVAECSELEKAREAVLGQVGVKHIARRRTAGSPDRVQSRWLVGLDLPEIPVEDDARVQRSLEYYTERPVGRELFQGMLFRCGAYRELIESTLIRHGLPKDLFAIVFAESGCEPEAVSPVGASGLWQLMPDTARAYNLRVKKGVIDERRSVPKSTDAAVRFLRDLRDKMAAYHPQGVWDLVFGSYNLGPFAMAARVEKAGGDVGFWDLVDAACLPDETVQFTPTIQALALILHNLQRFKFAGVQLRAPQLTSDLEVQPGTRLSLIARAASTSLDRIRALNLDITSGQTPDIPSYAVQVPKDVVWQARDTLAELTAARDESDLCVPSGFDWGRKHFTKEMADTCQRKLKSKHTGPVAPTASVPPG